MINHYFYPFSPLCSFSSHLKYQCVPSPVLFCVSLPSSSLCFRLPPGLPSPHLRVAWTSGEPSVCCQCLSKLLYFLNCCCSSCFLCYIPIAGSQHGGNKYGPAARAEGCASPRRRSTADLNSRGSGPDADSRSSQDIGSRGSRSTCWFLGEKRCRGWSHKKSRLAWGEFCLRQLYLLWGELSRCPGRPWGRFCRRCPLRREPRLHLSWGEPYLHEWTEAPAPKTLPTPVLRTIPAPGSLLAQVSALRTAPMGSDMAPSPAHFS